VPQLVESSIKNIMNDHPELIKENRVVIKQGDGRKGWDEEGIQFDAIHVGAATEEVPQKLIDQLAEGGRMVIPVGGSFFQEFMAFDKVNGQIKKTPISGVRYVPLTDLNKQIHSL
jgi:protein-L-isoaspartate(D-aspartate) O-methyltransferase